MYNTGSLPRCHSLVRFGLALQHERMCTAMLALPGSHKDDIEVFMHALDLIGRPQMSERGPLRSGMPMSDMVMAVGRNED